MAPGFDLEGKRGVDRRPCPIQAFRQFGEGRGNIDCRHRGSEPLERRLFAEDKRGQGLEDRLLAGERLLGGGGNLDFQFGKFLRRKAHRARHGLAVHEHRIVRRLQQLFTLRLRNLDEMAEKMIVLEL